MLGLLSFVESINIGGLLKCSLAWLEFSLEGKEVLFNLGKGPVDVLAPRSQLIPPAGGIRVKFLDGGEFFEVEVKFQL